MVPVECWRAVGHVLGNLLDAHILEHPPVTVQGLGDVRNARHVNILDDLSFALAFGAPRGKVIILHLLTMVGLEPDIRELALLVVVLQLAIDLLEDQPSIINQMARSLSL